jgi:two-component sensor histidine kinase
MIGRRPHEVEGKKIIEVMGEKGFKTIQPHVEAVLSGSRVEYETDVHFEGVGPHLLHVIYTPDRDQQGNVSGWVASITDITEKRQAQDRVAADLHATTLLRDLGSECVRDDRTAEQCFEKILEVGILIARAQKGTLQLFDKSSRSLQIAAQKGFDRPFIDFFQSVREDACACGTALQSGARVIVSDVLTNAIFVGQPSQELLLAEQVRAVISTPLVSSKGHTLGMLSTHFKEPHEPQSRELHLLDLLARLAADYLERKRHEEHQGLLIAELDHRVKNILARVAVVAKYTLEGGRPTNELAQALDGRIQSMADAHTLLSQGHWHGVSLAELARRQLAPYTREKNIMISGPDVTLSRAATEAVAMVLQELVTNAAKYGSLSTLQGKVLVNWERRNGAYGTQRVAIAWREIRGPPTKTPSHSSYGTNLIRNLIPHELGGAVDLVFAPEGLRCDIEIPLKEPF